MLVSMLSALTAFGIVERGERLGQRLWTAHAAAALTLACGFISMLLISSSSINGIFGAELDAPVSFSALLMCSVLTFGTFQAITHASQPLVWLGTGAALGIGLAASQQLFFVASVLPAGFDITEGSIARSFLGAAVLCAASVYLFRRLKGVASIFVGAASMCLALAFIGSGIALQAYPVFPWASVPLASEFELPKAFFITATVVISFALILLLGNRSRRKASGELHRMRALADISFEGIVVARGGLIVHANLSFSKLLERPCDSLIGEKLANFMINPGILDQLQQDDVVRVEAELAGTNGDLSVEIFSRDVELQGEIHQVFAIRDIRERKMTEARIQFLAHHDTVTGLPNRTQFLERLHQEINRSSRSGGEFAVICLDLDRFKEVNDNFGHAAGDQLLRLAAERLRNVFRTYDVVGRVGGDEFIIMQCAASQPSSSMTAARRVITAFAEPFDLDGLKVSIGASAGIAIYPTDAEDAEGLLTRADLALYRAKDEGRGTFRMFEPGMDEQLRERRILANDLRSAVNNDDIVLHYQPIVRLADGEVTGFEALPRWKHQMRGWINPALFMPLAEEIGLMPELGRRVLRRACAEAASWPHALGISLNLAPTQLHGALVHLVGDILTETGLEASRLELDVTEHMLQQRSHGDVLDAVKALGVRIAVDHFGTGATSLAGLRSCPIDRIKVDSSFVSGMTETPENIGLIRAISSLGRAFGIEVSAAGCDSFDQIEMLKHEGCLEAQGNIFGAPMPIIAYSHMTGRYQAETSTRPLKVAAG